MCHVLFKFPRLPITAPLHHPQGPSHCDLDLPTLSTYLLKSSSLVPFAIPAWASFLFHSKILQVLFPLPWMPFHLFYPGKLLTILQVSSQGPPVLGWPPKEAVSTRFCRPTEPQFPHVENHSPQNNHQLIIWLRGKSVILSHAPEWLLWPSTWDWPHPVPRQGTTHHPVGWPAPIVSGTGSASAEAQNLCFKVSMWSKAPERQVCNMPTAKDTRMDWCWPQGAQNLIKMEIVCLRKVWPAVKGSCAQLLERSEHKPKGPAQTPRQAASTWSKTGPWSQGTSLERVNLIPGSILPLSWPSCQMAGYGGTEELNKAWRPTAFKFSWKVRMLCYNFSPEPRE